MKKFIILISLALVTITCAVLEGLIESPPAQFVQLTGLLTIVCTGTFITWTMKVRAKGFDQDRS